MSCLFQVITCILFFYFFKQKLSYKISHSRENPSYNEINMKGKLSSSIYSDLVPSFLDNHVFAFKMFGENFENIVLDFDYPQHCIYGVSISLNLILISLFENLFTIHLILITAQ